MSFTWTDEKTEHVIGNLLRAGVLLSAAVVLAGGILYLAHHGRTHADYHLFEGQPEALRDVPGIASGAMKFDSRSIIQFGLLLLIITPIARVAFSAISFALERDYMYVVVSLIVLAVLIYGLAGS